MQPYHHMMVRSIITVWSHGLMPTNNLAEVLKLGSLSDAVMMTPSKLPRKTAG
jgi:hypothetical protein